MTDDLFIQPEKTFFTEIDLASAIVVAYRECFDREIKLKTLAILWAQFALECGRGKECMNWNIGGIKRLPNHFWTWFKTFEMINGVRYNFSPPHPQTHFCAYTDLNQAVTEHLKFLIKPQYSKAFEKALIGSPDLYVIELKKARYFTASVQSYSKAVNFLYKEFMKKYNNFLEDSETNDEFYERVEEKY